ncbi:MAG: AbrB/MazE/SpoVT family DNA-binding domain-containing protein [Thermoanaerobaculia bacterium]
MARVASRLRVTIPKSLAQRYDIRPGDEIDFVATGDGLRLSPVRSFSIETRLEIFDAATLRQKKRGRVRRGSVSGGRGWTRADLYKRGRSS